MLAYCTNSLTDESRRAKMIRSYGKTGRNKAGFVVPSPLPLDYYLSSRPPRPFPSVLSCHPSLWSSASPSLFSSLSCLYSFLLFSHLLPPVISAPRLFQIFICTCSVRSLHLHHLHGSAIQSPQSISRQYHSTGHLAIHSIAFGSITTKYPWTHPSHHWPLLNPQDLLEPLSLKLSD